MCPVFVKGNSSHGSAMPILAARVSADSDLFDKQNVIKNKLSLNTDLAIGLEFVEKPLGKFSDAMEDREIGHDIAVVHQKDLTIQFFVKHIKPF